MSKKPTSRLARRQKPQPKPAGKVFTTTLISTSGEWSVIRLASRREDIAAGLAKTLGGRPALIPVEDDSGHYLIVNADACNQGLAANPFASIMAGRQLYGPAVVCPSSID
jgi:hypothetical protein